MVNKTEVIERLKTFHMPNFIEEHRDIQGHKAAVLVPLFFQNDEIYVLLTVRSKNLRSHSGHVAFPGGKMDERDSDLLETALRESWEEIGLPRDKVEIVCQGMPFSFLNNVVVTPFIGFIDSDFSPIQNKREVSDIFSMPIINFLSAENHTSTVHLDASGNKSYVHHFEYADKDKRYFPFGFTAFICVILANIIFQKAPEFEISSLYKPNDPAKILLIWHQRRVKSNTMKANSKL
ncbi:peroxisomal coenzyme A diphosphatase NUDT7-like [Saccoglossus kowalevskii]|uniref:Peroxisomal coenzyme A diphosphatase NUDT7-like n=1 Tax=Saccoglossus kowalevskii TaxID=10224 RepID=A0ABM0GSD3_SACKO|nr:PREDICTED: peroxisomal coenzyme A diphosphatase NUDT7-like [Saccoglossus kowalevskii]